MFLSPGAAIMIVPRSGSGVALVSLFGGYFCEENSSKVIYSLYFKTFYCRHKEYPQGSITHSYKHVLFYLFAGNPRSILV